MQLVTYGAIAYELEKRRMEKIERSKDDVHVGGLLYYAFSDPIADMTDFDGDIRFDESRHEMVTDEMRMFGKLKVGAIEDVVLDSSKYSGIYNGSSRAVQVMDSSKATLAENQAMDEVMIEELMEANRRNIERLGNCIADGEIKINPVKSGKSSACTYCTYRSICMFDSKYGGNRYSRMYSKEQDKYDAKESDIKAVRKQIAESEKKIDSANKKYEKARAKFDAAEEKVTSRGDRATDKMRENLETARSALVEAENAVADIKEETKRLREKAAELGIEI